MSDAYSIAAFKAHGTEFPRRDGWRLLARDFDNGASLGVAAWNGIKGEGCLRVAVRMKQPCVIEDAIAPLDSWISEKAA